MGAFTSTTYITRSSSSNLLNTYYMLGIAPTTSHAIFIFTPHNNPIIKLLFLFFTL